MEAHGQRTCETLYMDVSSKLQNLNHIWLNHKPHTTTKWPQCWRCGQAGHCCQQEEHNRTLLRAAVLHTQVDGKQYLLTRCGTYKQKSLHTIKMLQFMDIAVHILLGGCLHTSIFKLQPRQQVFHHLSHRFQTTKHHLEAGKNTNCMKIHRTKGLQKL